MKENGFKFKKKDIFDRIMMMPFFKIYNPFYTKHKETLLYLFFGVIAFMLNLGLFAAINYFLHINELLNNIICWIICVLFQFFTNRIWVFEGYVSGRAAFAYQLMNFTGGRVFTLVLEELILMIFISRLGWNTITVKLGAQIAVIILNYFISKMWIFKKH